MTDRIEMHRLGSVFAPAQKIRPVKRKGHDPRERPFDRHLTDDGDGQEKDPGDLDADNQGGGLEAGGPEGDAPCDDGKARPGQEDRIDEEPPPGSFVDIRV